MNEELIKIQDLKAKDVMSNNYEKITISTSIADALKKFRNKAEVCFVFEKDKYRGVITERSIIRSRFDPKHHNVSNIVINTPIVDIDENAINIAMAMLQSKMRFLPVAKNNKIIGQISNDLFLKKLKHTFVANEELGTIMTKNIISVDEKTPISTVMNLMRENNISRVLIKDDKMEICAIAAMHDIITKIIYPSDRISRGQIVDEKLHSLSTPIFEIATAPIITLKSNDKIKQAIDIFLNESISSIVIENQQNNKIIGLATISDVFEYIAKLKNKNQSLKYVLSLSNINQNEIDKKFIETKILKINKKYRNYLDNDAVIFIHAQFKNKQNHIKMHLNSKKDVIIATDSDFDFKICFSNAIRKLDELIEKNKEK